MKKDSVIKHSATVQITNRINLFQRKTWNALLSNAYHDLPNSETYQISEQELKNLLGITTRDQKLLKNALEALVTCAVEFNYLGKDKKHAWEISALLSRANIEAGICTYEYNSILRQLLYKPEIYARISLSLQNKFKSKHALALYELCIDYYISKNKRGFTPYISINEFRALMGFEENQYKLFKHLKNDVIIPAISEINKESDIYVEVEYQRECRRITALRFHITPNPNYRVQDKFDNPAALPFANIPEDSGVPAIQVFIESLKPYHISAKFAKQAIHTHGLEKAIAIRDYVIERIKLGNIARPESYLAACLRDGISLKEKPITAQNIKILKKAAACFKKIHGSCGAEWKHYKDQPNETCHNCPKFKDQRTAN